MQWLTDLFLLKEARASCAIEGIHISDEQAKNLFLKMQLARYDEEHRCRAVTKKGTRCQNYVYEGPQYCGVHRCRTKPE